MGGHNYQVDFFVSSVIYYFFGGIASQDITIGGLLIIQPAYKIFDIFFSGFPGFGFDADLKFFIYKRRVNRLDAIDKGYRDTFLS